jgi:hypothetical protein
MQGITLAGGTNLRQTNKPKEEADTCIVQQGTGTNRHQPPWHFHFEMSKMFSETCQ